METTILPSEELKLSESTLKDLQITYKWGKFLAIVGMIGAAILVLSALGMLLFGAFVPSVEVVGFPFVLMGIIYLILGAVYFIPAWYLLKFSNSLNKMVSYRQQEKVGQSFNYLMKLFRFMGILTIVLMAVYVLAIVIGVFIGFAGVLGAANL